MLTAVQKIRLTLAGSPLGEPHFQHEGEEVVRWITGGTLPDLSVTFHQQDTMIEVRCSTCHSLLGRIPSHFGENMAQELASMRQMGHQH